MSKSLKIYLIVFVVLITVMIAIDQTREKPLDWSPTYYLDEKKPLDLYVLHNELDHLVGDSIVRYDSNPYVYFQQQDSLEMKNETYLFIDDYVYFDKVMTSRLLHAVSQGSTLFIVSDGFMGFLTDTLRTTCDFAPYKMPVPFTPLSGEKPGVKLKLSKEKWSGEEYVYSPIFGQYAFVYADPDYATALGYMELPDEAEYVNFMEFKFGEGKVILHNQPVVFANYSLLSNEPAQQYVERVFSYLPDQPVVWFVEKQLSGTSVEKNQLGVVFEYPALRMTWLIFLYGLIGFIFFTAKRKQRVVPVIKPQPNTTVEFTQTIGNLYFQAGNYTDIARKKIIYFFDRVRRTYHIDTQLPDEKLIERLHLKSGKERDLINEIVSLMGKVNAANRCGKQELIQLSMLIDRFWDDKTPKG